MSGALPPRPFVYPILDVAWLRGRSAAAVANGLVRGGARLVQLRGKDVSDRELLALAREVAAAVAAAGARLVVNDRADVARLAGAAGVHLGQSDLDPEDARRVLGVDALVGHSTHDLGQLATARDLPVDYIAFGPVFATGSKARPDPVVGLDLLRRARAATHRPLVAIGGICDGDRARDVVAAGADGVAVISAVMAPANVESAMQELVAAVAGAS